MGTIYTRIAFAAAACWLLAAPAAAQEIKPMFGGALIDGYDFARDVGPKGSIVYDGKRNLFRGKYVGLKMPAGRRAIFAWAHDTDVVPSTWAHSPFLEDWVSTPHHQRGFDDNYAVAREVAADQDVKLFEFDTLMPKDKSDWADGFHVNEKGALIKAKLFAKFVHNSGLINANH